MTENNFVYKLIDSGNGRKLEQFGSVLLIRPSLQAVWKTGNHSVWSDADFEFKRNISGTGRWQPLKSESVFPKDWFITYNNLKYLISANEFGNVGLFPEHFSHTEWMLKKLSGCPASSILNLFSYSGSGSLGLVSAGHKLTNVDSSKSSMDLLGKNLETNDLSGKTRLILDDVGKFLKREADRKNKYDAVILDPPTFGRGRKGEVFKIEKDLIPMLEVIKQVLEKDFKFVLFTCHSPGFTLAGTDNIFKSVFNITPETGETKLEDSCGKSLPAGIYARF